MTTTATKVAETILTDERITDLETALRAAQATIGGLEMEVARLTVEAGKGAQDAARYRFVRQHPAMSGVMVKHLMVGNLPLDESIDASIKAMAPVGAA